MARKEDILVSKTLYQLGILTLIAAIMWVGVGIYSANSQEFKLDIDKASLEPIYPTIDQDVIKALSRRVKIDSNLTPQPEKLNNASESADIDIGGTI